jgi:8-oxo-dGTP pyrophosphatase MutT (NUDIX family)
MIRNRRFAAGRTLLELPAGTLEADEPPGDCAARELAEETGYQAGRIEPLMEFYTSPGV